MYNRKRMKTKKILFGLVSGALLLTGCDVNEIPTFNDADAFVAFTKSTASIQENSTDSVVIEVLCSSLSGVSGEVSIAIVEDTTNTAAKVGELFTYYTTTGRDTLSFDKSTASQYIIVKPIDNEVFGGDKKFSFELKDAKGVNLGTSKIITVTVGDNEHPLAFILNDYAASADSYFASRGHFDWTITIAKDADDLSKVWVYNLDPYFAANGFVGPDYNAFYGIVNEDKTEIAVPVEQALGYQNTILVGFTGADPDESDTMNTGDNIIIEIQDNGNALCIKHGFGIYDEGWWNIMYGNLTITKK